MKLFISLVLFIGMSGLLFAATKQPIANGPSVLTLAQINSVSPRYAGQTVVCSDCQTANAGKYSLCLSTGTTAGAWIIVSSLTAITACR